MNRLLIAASLILLIVTPALGATGCGEPAPAPHYQAGEKWTRRDEKGVERTHRVVGCEEVATPAGTFTAVKTEVTNRWPAGRGSSRRDI